jgi:serine/threonine protein kinase
VYRARDTRLDRTVAIKTLSAQFSTDPVRKQQFERQTIGEERCWVGHLQFERGSHDCFSESGGIMGIGRLFELCVQCNRSG